MENFKDGEELLKSIAGVFIDHAPKCISDIETAITQHDAGALKRRRPHVERAP